MPIYDAKIVFMQGNVLCIYPKAAKTLLTLEECLSLNVQVILLT